MGYLSWSDTGHYEQITSEGFAAGLREEGFVEGKNLVILKRAANFETVRFKEHARELAKVPVDVFFAPATAMASAAWYADRKTPIVIATIIDPVALDFAQSLAHPGTRVTGVTAMRKELSGKRLEFLKETVPGLKRVGLLIDDAMRESCRQEVNSIEATARQAGLTLVFANVGGRDGVDPAFRKLAGAGVQAVMASLSSTRGGLEKDFSEAALKYRLPLMSEVPSVVSSTGLMSYGPDFGDVFRRAGHYVGRILKGENPADMPIEEPSRFRLSVNLKTAKALGVTVPKSVLILADEVIE